jgi:Raf kinase inhibitor-like YbhB/YbcL family protein
MEDSDAVAIVGYPYVHWNVFNIPASVREISENATLHAMPLGSIEGVNADGVPKYAGPCPPQATGIHHYHFSLYALNKETLTINTGRTWQRSEFEQKFASEIITKTEISGLYKL